MLQKELETTKSPNSWWATQDARMKSIANASRYSEAQKVEAERIKLGADMVYYNKDIHINYRQKFITIKVDDARVKDLKQLNFLEEEWTQKGYSKAITNQGVIYRIPKV